MTSSFEFSTYPARLSDAERDKALSVLRDGVAKGRLSHDTFIRRMELALVARRADELAALTADLPRESRFSRVVLGSVKAVSGFTVRLRRAWRAEKLPKLLLPHPAHGHPLRIGRDPANGLRLTHETVSRVHAELTHQAGPVGAARPRFHQRHDGQRPSGGGRGRGPRGGPGGFRPDRLPSLRQLTGIYTLLLGNGVDVTPAA